MADLRILGLGPEVELGESLRLGTNLVGPGPDVRYQWDFGDGSASDAAAPEKRYAQAGTYAVSLTVSNAAGDSRTARAQLVAGRFSLVEGLVCDGATPRSGWCHVNYAPELMSMHVQDQDKLLAWTRPVMRDQDALMRSADGGRTWTTIGPVPSRVRSLVTASADLAIALGTQSEVWLTRDGGRSWTLRGIASRVTASGTTRLVGYYDEPLMFRRLPTLQMSRDGLQLLGVDLPKPFAKGRASIWSRDGGLTWFDAPSANTALTPAGVWFHLQGDHVVREVGAERTASLLPGLGRDAGIAFSGELDGWVIDQRALWRTQDGGNSWTRSEHGVPVGQAPWLRATGGRVLWLSSSQRNEFNRRQPVYRSDDGGNVWRRVAPPGNIEGDGTLYSDEELTPLTSDMAFALRGRSGSLCRSAVFTTDGGSTWTEQEMPDSISGCIGPIRANRRQGITMVQTNGDIYGVVVSSPRTFAVTGEGSIWTALFGLKDSEVPGRVLQNLTFGDARLWVGDSHMTRDGGRTWEQQDLLPGVRLPSLHFGSGSLAWAGLETAAAVARTTDGGKTWGTVRLLSPEVFKPTSTNHVYFLDDRTGWALASSPSPVIRQSLWRTQDAGQSWDYVGPAPDGVHWVDLWFTDANVGIAVGSAGRLYRSADGGQSWRLVSHIDPGAGVRQVYFRNRDLGFALSSKLIWRTTDGGLTWQEAALPERSPTRQLTDIEFASDRIGWIVGSDSELLHSQDGGATWQRHVAQIRADLDFRHVLAVDEDTVIVVDRSGRALTTVTGGQ